MQRLHPAREPMPGCLLAYADKWVAYVSLLATMGMDASKHSLLSIKAALDAAAATAARHSKAALPQPPDFSPLHSITLPFPLLRCRGSSDYSFPAYSSPGASTSSMARIATPILTHPAPTRCFSNCAAPTPIYVSTQTDMAPLAAAHMAKIVRGAIIPRPSR
jgi:hypothetical protein